MRSRLNIILLLLLISVFLSQCAKKGRAIVEPRYGQYNFTTYTIDSFRFRIILNGVVLTDSLVSPVGIFSKAVSFMDTGGRLQIIDADNNNQLILDTAISMTTGLTNFSLFQLLEAERPYIPQPPANEPLPASGNYKVRFQYTSFIGDGSFPARPFYYDSVTCYIRKNGIDIDTVVLSKYGITPFYEAVGGGVATFSVMIEDPATGNVIDATTSPTIGGNFTGFNTVSISGRAIVDDWRLIRMY